MKNVLFILNPISGDLDKEAFKGEIRSFCRINNLNFYLFETKGDDDEKRLLQHISEATYDRIAVCGGDGTINLAVRALTISNTDLPLAIIPLGSANGTAKEFEIDEDPKRALENIINGHLVNLDILQVNDNYCIHLSDLGFNAKLIKRFNEFGQRGMIGYARHFLAILRNPELSNYTIRANNEQYIFQSEMVVFANGRLYGTGAAINPDGKPDDGQFEVCIFKNYPWYALAGITFRFFTGQLKKSRYVKIISTRHAEVDVSPAETLQVDGEVIGTTSHVKVTVSPRQIRMLVPNLQV